MSPIQWATYTIVVITLLITIFAIYKSKKTRGIYTAWFFLILHEFIYYSFLVSSIDLPYFSYPLWSQVLRFHEIIVIGAIILGQVVSNCLTDGDYRI